MTRHKYAHSRWPFELPSLLLVSLWVGLWYAWPRANTSPTHVRPQTQTRVRYVELAGLAAPRREELLSFLFQPRERDVIADDPAPVLAAPALTVHPHVLPFPKRADNPTPSDPELPALQHAAAASLRGYQPAWPRLDPFGSGPAYALRVELAPCRDLVACGFALPDQALDALNVGDNAWEFTYYVVCDAAGHTRDVFALADPIDGGLQSNLITILNQARTRPGVACEGRVTVRRLYAPQVEASPAGSRKE